MIVEWDDDVIRLESASGTLRLAWGDWHAWVDGRRALLLLQSARLYNMVPATALDAAQRSDIQARLTAAGVKRLGRPYAEQSSPKSR